MYARRQRRVQSGSTNVQTLVLTTLNPDEILSANLLYPILTYKIGYHPTRSPRWRSGHAADCRSATIRFNSGPWLRPVSSNGNRSDEDRASTFFGCKQKKSKSCGDSGHSCRETPGLIPNPAVKPTHVVCCTWVRESLGTIPSCYHLSFLHGISSHEILTNERMLLFLSLFGRFCEYRQVRDLRDRLIL